jgi:stage II sporulation protein D
VKNGDEVELMDMQDYLVGVVAAEMPAEFQPEALKAQAVAARTYALYCANTSKHADAEVCTDYNCCQAWHSQQELEQSWGDGYEKNLALITEAVQATEGQYLSYDGAPVFAAFHASSCGATEDCGAIWSSVPYLISVDSPESADTVPNYISTVELSALDFRDTILSAYPSAKLTGSADGWLGAVALDDSGRVSSVNIGGVDISGKELRELFSLRSTAFTLECSGQGFLFTVTGNGHGVGMSQYGANVMAADGSDYAQILAHYYPGTVLVA